MPQTIKDLLPPKSTSIPIHFKTEDEMLLWFNKLIHISTRLMYWISKFDNEYGATNRDAKHKWENKMMQHLAEKQIPLVQDLSQLKITISNE